MKLLHLAIWLLISQYSALGQTVTDSKKIRVGVNFGLSVSDLHLKNTDQGQVEGTGPVAGVMMQLRANRYILQPGIQLIFKGSGRQYGSYPASSDLAYLEFPLLVIYPVAIGKSSWHLGAGFSPAFHLPSIGYSEYGEALKPFDLGITSSTSFHLRTGFFLKLEYTLGLINILDPRYTTMEMRNRCLSICLGYVFQHSP